MRGTLLLAVLLSAVAPSPAASQSQPPPPGPDPITRFGIDRSHSAMEFVVRFMGLSKVRGRFSDFSGAIVYDAEVPEESTVAVSIDVGSIDTDVNRRDEHLRSPDWFDAEQWPAITFTSRSIERTAEDEFVVTGPLTIKETTREVSIPLTRVHGVQTDAWGNWRIGFEGALTIERKEFGVEGHSFFNEAFDAARVGVSDEVRIEFTISGRVFNMEKLAYSTRDKPSVGQVIEEIHASDGIEAAIRRYHELKTESPDAYDFDIGQLNRLGYKLLQRGLADDALQIFQLNLSQYPDSGAALDSLAEAHARAGNRRAAIEYARRSLEIEPNEPYTLALLTWLETSSEFAPAR